MYQSRSTPRAWLGLALAATVILTASAPVRADLIGNFSGNTQ